MPAPLSGIRVIEVANYVAAPSVGALLCDLGAEVIKVEPPGGEVMRATRSGTADNPAPLNLYFQQENRGKRSITVSLDRPGGTDVVHALLARSDALLTNLIAPRLRRYGLMPGDVHARNPHVIHVSVTGYGIHGPDSDRLAFDYAAYWARSGIMGLMGHPGDPPVLSRVAQGDHTTGVFALAGLLSALRLRDQTGKGQVVEVSLQQAGLYTIATDMTRALQDRQQPARMDRTCAPNPLFNTYQTADRRWLMVVHMTPDPYWSPFCHAIGRPEWADDPRFSDMARRADHAAFLSREIQATIATRPFAEWATLFDGRKLIWAPAMELPDVAVDPQLRALGAFETIPHPSGDFETIGVPFNIWDADVRARGAAPEPGEHTSDLLEELGYDTDRIAELAAAGVFG